MSRLAPLAALVLLAHLTLVPVFAVDADRDFSGRWFLDSGSGERQLTITQSDSTIRCTATTADGSESEWKFALNGDDSKYPVGAESRNTAVKWEGSALLVNTLVTGPRDYTIMDRWKLSRDRATLTVTRQIMRGARTDESTLVYRREGARNTAPSVTSDARPTLMTRPDADPPTPEEYVVPAGTHILLALRNAVDTKHSREGDRVYLETLYPVSSGGRIVIPRGSFVSGVIAQNKQAGVKSKGELYIRFDSLTLPNGVSRDFTSRLSNADTPNGKVDREEGKITGQRDGARDAKTTAEGAAIGATVGGIAGSAAGAPLKGVGIGAAAGAAAGLAGVFMGHKADAGLPRGATVEMVTDRDLRYQRSELGRR